MSSDLARTMVVCGLLSGTQPLTVMGMMVLLGGENGRRNAWFYILGCSLAQAVVLLASGLALGGAVDQTSTPGRSLIGLRIVVGVALLGIGLRFRRTGGPPSSETPPALARLTNMRPFGALAAGVAIADYTGAMLAAAALTTASVGTGGAFVAWALYGAFATGLLIVALVTVSRSARAEGELQRAISWVLRNRRRLASWFCIAAGLVLVADGITTLVVTS